VEDIIESNHTVARKTLHGQLMLFRFALARAAYWNGGGQTEAAVDLASLAGLYPVSVIYEILNVDGTMARMPESGDLCLAG
jgi:3,4-dihydroxy-2-butanone 4-phosphate synthase